MTTSLVEKQIVIHNLLLTYYQRQAAKKSRGVVLFLHGWRSNSQLWFKVLSQLTDFEIYLLDLPGFGKSEIQKKAFQLDNFVEVVKSFCDKLNLSHINLIGHSFGGKVAIKLASRQAPLVNSLILVDSSGIKPKGLIIEIKRLMAQLTKPIFKLPFMKPVRTKIYEIIGSDDYVNRTDIVTTYLNTIKEDITNILPTIKAPTLLIWGRTDKETPLKDAYTMKEKIPQSQLEILDGGHFIFLDQPEQFSNLVFNFLTKHVST